MFRLRKHLAGLVLVIAFAGWLTYPGWYHQWYYTHPEEYAFPAGFSHVSDPHWGFWWW